MKRSFLFAVFIIIFLSQGVSAQSWYPPEIAGDPAIIGPIDVRITMLDYWAPHSMPPACAEYRGYLEVDFDQAVIVVFEQWACSDFMTEFILLQEFNPPLVQVLNWDSDAQAYAAWTDSGRTEGNIITFRETGFPYKYKSWFTQARFLPQQHCCPWFDFGPGTIWYDVALVVDGKADRDGVAQMPEAVQ